MTPPAITRPGRMHRNDIAMTSNQKLLGRASVLLIAVGVDRLINCACPAAQSIVLRNISPLAYWLKKTFEAKSASPNTTTRLLEVVSATATARVSGPGKSTVGSKETWPLVCMDAKAVSPHAELAVETNAMGWLVKFAAIVRLREVG